MFNKTAIPILLGLIFSATAQANIHNEALTVTDDTAIFSSIGLKANSLFNDFFTFSAPSANNGIVDGGTDVGAGAQPRATTPHLALRNDSGFSPAVVRMSDTPPSFWAIAAHQSATASDAVNSNLTIAAAPEAGPEAWSILVIGVGLVAFRLRRRPGINIFSYS